MSPRKPRDVRSTAMRNSLRSRCATVSQTWRESRPVSLNPTRSRGSSLRSLGSPPRSTLFADPHSAWPSRSPGGNRVKRHTEDGRSTSPTTWNASDRDARCSHEPRKNACSMLTGKHGSLSTGAHTWASRGRQHRGAPRLQLHQPRGRRVNGCRERRDSRRPPRTWHRHRPSVPDVGWHQSWLTPSTPSPRCTAPPKLPEIEGCRDLSRTDREVPEPLGRGRGPRRPVPCGGRRARATARGLSGRTGSRTGGDSGRPVESAP